MRRLGVPVTAEAEDRGRVAERVREIWKRRDTDAAADEQRPFDVEAVAVAQRTEDCQPIARLQRAERPRSGANRIDQEGELAGRRESEAHRPRQRP